MQSTSERGQRNRSPSPPGMISRAASHSASTMASNRTSYHPGPIPCALSSISRLQFQHPDAPGHKYNIQKSLTQTAPTLGATSMSFSSPRFEHSNNLPGPGTYQIAKAHDTVVRKTPASYSLGALPNTGESGGRLKFVPPDSPGFIYETVKPIADSAGKVTAFSSKVPRFTEPSERLGPGTYRPEKSFTVGAKKAASFTMRGIPEKHGGRLQFPKPPVSPGYVYETTKPLTETAPKAGSLSLTLATPRFTEDQGALGPGSYEVAQSFNRGSALRSPAYSFGGGRKTGRPREVTPGLDPAAIPRLPKSCQPKFLQATTSFEQRVRKKSEEENRLARVTAASPDNGFLRQTKTAMHRNESNHLRVNNCRSPDPAYDEQVQAATPVARPSRPQSKSMNMKPRFGRTLKSASRAEERSRNVSPVC